MRENESKCMICQSPLETGCICQTCRQRSKILKNELPPDKCGNYDTLMQYQNDLMYESIFANKNMDRKIARTKLLTIADILQEKYLIEDASQEAIKFLSDVNDDQIDDEELVELYQIDIPEKYFEDNDFSDRKQNQAPKQTYIPNNPNVENKAETYDHDDDEKKESSAFSKGCGGTLGVGCGIFILLAIIIVIFLVSTGITMDSIFK